MLRVMLAGNDKPYAELVLVVIEDLRADLSRTLFFSCRNSAAIEHSRERSGGHANLAGGLWIQA